MQALREERRLRFRSLLFRVERCERCDDVFKLVVDPVEDTASLDESIEGSPATWSAPSPGHADILSVVAEDNLLTLRHATTNPPPAGGLVAVRVPDFLGHLVELWEDDSLAAECLAWFDSVRAPDQNKQPSGLSLSCGRFSDLRPAQRRAFELCRYDQGFLFGPPGTGKTAALGRILAAHLTQRPRQRVLLLSTTNTAVDQALIATDIALQQISPYPVGVDDIRNRCKRVGLHFIPGNYDGRQHLLCARREPIRELTTLEAQRPDSTDDRAYAEWRDAIETIRRRIRERTYEELAAADLHAMTTTRAVFDFEMLRNFSYDLVVFDEASQVGLAHASMLAQLAKQVVFVGDPKQLTPVVLSDLSDGEKWLGASVFDHAPREGPMVCMLDEQNRMSDEICRVVSHVFYEGKLRVAPDARLNPQWRAERQLPLLPELGDHAVHIRTIPQEGIRAEPGWYRPLSMEFICQTVHALVRDLPPEEILVVTPFRAQRHRIKRRLRELGLAGVSVSTVHRAQGSERHTVLFDPVRGDSKWLRSPEGERLINVAISRAKARLVITLSRGDRQNIILDYIAQMAETSDAPF